MRGQRAKKGQKRNARLVAVVVAEAVAAKLAEQRAVAVEMKLGEDAAWDRNLYESEYLWWWEKWNYEERVLPMVVEELNGRPANWRAQAMFCN